MKPLRRLAGSSVETTTSGGTSRTFYWSWIISYHSTRWTPSEIAIVRSEFFTSVNDLNLLIMLLKLRADVWVGSNLLGIDYDNRVDFVCFHAIVGSSRETEIRQRRAARPFKNFSVVHPYLFVTQYYIIRNHKRKHLMKMLSCVQIAI